MSVLGREIYLYAVLYDRFGPEAISDQVLDANNLDIDFLGYLNSLRQTCHGSILVDDLDQGSGGI